VVFVRCPRTWDASLARTVATNRAGLIPTRAPDLRPARALELELCATLGGVDFPP